MWSFYIILLSLVFSCKCNEEILNERSGSLHSLLSCTKSDSGEPTINKFECFEKLYFDELKLAESNEIKTSQGIIAFWYTSPGNSLHYKLEYNGNKTDLNLN